MSEHASVTELTVDSWTFALSFSADREYVVGGGFDTVRVWRLKDGKQVARIATSWCVLRLAVSKDGRWIAAGTSAGGVFVWDAETYLMVFSHKEKGDVNAVDFSPDSTRLVVASNSHIVTVWAVATWGPVFVPFHHQNAVKAAEYSPQGDRIVTATSESIRLYDSNGRFVVENKVSVVPTCSNGLFWSYDQLFVVSDDAIKQIEGSTGSTVSEWSLPHINLSSCIALSQRGEFLICSANRTVTVWNTSTHTQLDLVERARDIRSIALSQDDQFLAMGGEDGRITIKNLSNIHASAESRHVELIPSQRSIPLSHLHPTLHDPEIHIDDAALDSWKNGQLADADALLTKAVADSRYSSRHVLASRALVRARLLQWDAAIDDAEKSIEMQPSVIGYIAKSATLAAKGEKHEGYRACDIALQLFHSTHVTCLLLVKAVIVFMAGEYDDGIARLDDLITMLPFNSVCYVVQAYMYFYLGSSRMRNSDYKSTIQSFERARTQMQRHTGRQLLLISLISGWKFDDLAVAIQQRLCEALYAAGRVNDAGESLLGMVNSCEEVYVSGPIIQWVSDLACRCLSTPESDGDAASATLYGGATMFHGNLNPAIPTPLLREWAKSTLANRGWEDALVTAVGFTAARFTICRAICEHLEMTDRLMDAIECFNQTSNEATRDEQTEWTVDFKLRCSEKLERLGDAAAYAGRHDDAITRYSAALSLNLTVSLGLFIKRSKAYVEKQSWQDALDDASQVRSLIPRSQWGYENVLTQWARVKLMDGSWRDALATADNFKVPIFIIYRALCEHLETIDHIMDAADCFRDMENELAEEIQDDEANWVLGFKSRCCKKLQVLGDNATNVQRYDEALSKYSIALSLNPTSPEELLVRRSKVYLAKGLLENALSDANKVIMLDPSSPWGYERKHAALHVAGDYENAIYAFQIMLSKISESSDPEICDHFRRYVSPAQTKTMIEVAVENAIRDSPLVLINTESGRLLDKSGQAYAFESQPTFWQLVSSSTTHIDRARIEQKVTEYYRYATLSHKWQENEPLFDKVIHLVVYDLEKSPTHDKLQMFCKIVRDAGIHWAWSDTCCINKADHVVLQEALVSMFRWYQASAMTIVFLLGVRSPPQRGALVKSIWNTRAWTLQEYHASKVVRFYTEDWTPYLNPDIPNHKESPEIISEMEEATGVLARCLVTLRPGLDDIREKLRLASMRRTTRVEDAAYSLLGIFSLSLPVVYGEGDQALGRLLAQLLTSSGDASLLAWTGKSGSFNSCLPANITVFSQLPTSHIPLAAEGSDTDATSVRLQASVNFGLVMELYDQLSQLPTPYFVGQRAKLPCITFKLGPVSASRNRPDVFRAQTTALGAVEIETKEDLSRLDSLYLIHPWIDFLLDQQPLECVAEMMSEENVDERSFASEFPSFLGPSDVLSTVSQTLRAARFVARLGRPFGGRLNPAPGNVGSLRPPSSLSPTEKQTRALRLMVRLVQPFGALLLTRSLGNVAAYRRVAGESPITVQVQEITPTVLKKLVEGVRTLDVL